MKFNWKKILFTDSSDDSYDLEDEVRSVGICSYSDLLGLNRDFQFVLTKSKCKDEAEFNSIAADAEFTLSYDLKRLGESFYKIDPALRNKLMGTIGSMTLLADDDGKITVKFHKRDEKGLWDGISTKFPEKGTTAKHKYEIFFVLEEDDED